MGKIQRFIFLSETFYSDYPAANYPEMEQKKTRPYVQVIVEISGVIFAIPLRSAINHPFVLWTDKKNHCGIDFSKAVVISNEKYIDKVKIPHLRQNEFNALRGKDYRIRVKFEKYIEKYKEARKDLSKPINRILCSYSTLQYFEKYI
jgi:protein AbiQ